MDRETADFFDTVSQIKKKLHAKPAVVQLPIGVGEKFLGVIDIVKSKSYIWYDEEGKIFKEEDIPQEYILEYEEYRRKLIEQLADYDDMIAEKYLNHQEISVEEIKKVLRRLTIENIFVPIFCGSAYKNRGIQPLLDGICDYLPSPNELGQIVGKEPDTLEEKKFNREDDAPLCGLVFKIQMDRYFGKLVYTRIYSGVLSSGDTVYNPRNKKVERVNRIVRLHADKKEDIEKAYSGDIVGLVGLKNFSTGDTICTKQEKIILGSLHIPEPVIWVKIEPKTAQDEEKLAYGLNSLLEEDPTLKCRVDPETGQTIIAGMGELHIDIVVDRLFREYGVKTRIGAPQVAYREYFTKRVIEEGRYIKQSGGRGQYGHVVLEFIPLKRNSGIIFTNKISQGKIPKEYIPAIEDGVREALECGPLHGYPVIDLEVRLIDGSYHEVDSSEIAFKTAAEIAVKNAGKKADCILLEPIMLVEVTVPDEYLGEVLSDFNSRRGKIIAMETKGHIYHIKANVPLANMFGYATVLRSLTQGRAYYTMEPSHYEEVPQEVLEALGYVTVKL